MKSLQKSNVKPGIRLEPLTRADLTLAPAAGHQRIAITYCFVFNNLPNDETSKAG